MCVNVTKEHRQAIYYVSLLSNSHQLTPRTLRCPLRDDIQKLCPIAARSQLWPAAPKRRVRDPRSTTTRPAYSSHAFSPSPSQRFIISGEAMERCSEEMSRDTAASCSEASIASELQRTTTKSWGKDKSSPTLSTGATTADSESPLLLLVSRPLRKLVQR